MRVQVGKRCCNLTAKIGDAEAALTASLVANVAQDYRIIFSTNKESGDPMASIMNAILSQFDADTLEQLSGQLGASQQT